MILIILILDDNRITELNGIAFTNLLILRKVRLLNNICISEVFTSARQISQLKRNVSEACGFSSQPRLTTTIENTNITIGDNGARSLRTDFVLSFALTVMLKLLT